MTGGRGCRDGGARKGAVFFVLLSKCTHVAKVDEVKWRRKGAVIWCWSNRRLREQSQIYIFIGRPADEYKK